MERGYKEAGWILRQHSRPLPQRSNTAKKQAVNNHEMGKRHEQKPHRGRHRHGQHAHENMLRTTGHQGNTNQNHNEIPPHTSENGKN
ncbi:hypothetical protein VULLAG_LOCUS7170 [Vulpes lagopus]